MSIPQCDVHQVEDLINIGYTPFVKIRSFVVSTSVVISKKCTFSKLSCSQQGVLLLSGHDMTYCQKHEMHVNYALLCHLIFAWFLCLILENCQFLMAKSPVSLGKSAADLIVFNDACSSLKSTKYLFCVLEGPHSRILNCNYLALMETLKYCNKTCKVKI